MYRQNKNIIYKSSDLNLAETANKRGFQKVELIQPLTESCSRIMSKYVSVQVVTHAFQVLFEVLVALTENIFSSGQSIIKNSTFNNSAR